MILIRRVKTAWHLLRAGRVRSFVKALNYRIRALRGSRLWVSPRVWSTAQAGELQFHVENASRLAQQFERDNADMLAKFGFKVLDYAGRTIVDIGAGSRLRTRWFKDARIFVIEPLADRYIRDVPCCDLPAADRVYAVPAEEFVSGLVGVADLVISINALDHCRDFGAVIKNIVLYANPNALIFLSFDSHEIANEMHPLVLTKNVCKRTFEMAGLIVVRYEEDVEYGSGVGMSWWLKKAAQQISG